MVRVFFLAVWVLSFVNMPLVSAQQPADGAHGSGAAANAASEQAGDPDCRQCHFCSAPTHTSKCLVHVCTRGQRRLPAGTAEDHGPDVIFLDMLEGNYLPVPFDHEGHAKMAEMGGGCTTCHHFTPKGEQHPKCVTCHDLMVAGTDIHKPGLKGAYHQQCMNCHREWAGQEDCAQCHVAKTGAGSGGAATEVTGLLGRIHPPIPEPDTDYFGGQPAADRDSLVLFGHQKHVKGFGLNCVDCHREPSCTRCHTRDVGGDTPQTLAQHHRHCLNCHKQDMRGTDEAAECKRCHWQKDEPKPAQFAHADVGWPLKDYHQGANCRDCHQRVPFAKLDKNCQACHKDWDPDSFDHRVTGQVLDDNHADADCTDCHSGQRYEEPPTCSECHDEEDDGIAFPARRPGPSVKFQTSMLHRKGN